MITTEYIDGKKVVIEYDYEPADPDTGWTESYEILSVTGLDGYIEEDEMIAYCKADREGQKHAAAIEAAEIKRIQWEPIDG